MMTTVKCKHSGIEFLAQSHRSKQHPRIATLKIHYAKRGRRTELEQALENVAKFGRYRSIDQYIAQVMILMSKEIE